MATSPARRTEAVRRTASFPLRSFGALAARRPVSCRAHDDRSIGAPSPARFATQAHFFANGPPKQGTAGRTRRCTGFPTHSAMWIHSLRAQQTRAPSLLHAWLHHCKRTLSAYGGGREDPADVDLSHRLRNCDNVSVASATRRLTACTSSRKALMFFASFFAAVAALLGIGGGKHADFSRALPAPDPPGFSRALPADAPGFSRALPADKQGGNRGQYPGVS